MKRVNAFSEVWNGTVVFTAKGRGVVSKCWREEDATGRGTYYCRVVWDSEEPTERISRRELQQACRDYNRAVEFEEGDCGLDEDRVREIAREVAGPQEIVVVRPETQDRVSVGTQHAAFEAVCRLASARLNIWLHGPAGSGKTTMAYGVAKALGLRCFTTSVCKQTSKADLLGYKNMATGEYQPTDLREAYENGGVFLLDECDAGSPAVLVVMNNLISGDVCGFPDGQVKKHKDFILLAGANTRGAGADREYNSRSQIDAATLDRFAFVPMDYDPAVEAAMCGVSVEDLGEVTPCHVYRFENRSEAVTEVAVKRFCKKLTGIRNRINSLGVRHMVGPRARYVGVTMLRLGFTHADTMDVAVRKGLDDDAWKKIS